MVLFPNPSDLSDKMGGGSIVGFYLFDFIIVNVPVSFIIRFQVRGKISDYELINIFKNIFKVFK
ncbi:MAG: hypothetical protein EBU80_04565 [Chitinophagia bacterium]|nr:hypothetical protein [Chitinophagia bacterium]